jgi:hypothetical protein
MPANLMWPRTGIRGTLDMGETKVVCVLTKITPEANQRLTEISEIEKLNLYFDWRVNDLKLKQIANTSTALRTKDRTATGKLNAAVRFDE